MRKFVSLFLLLLTVILLCSCHGKIDTEPFEVPQNFDEDALYEISFWAKNDTNATQIEIYKKAISDFQALYPNITVNLRLYNDYSKIYNDVITNMATGTTPNVCITYPDHIATYLSGENTVVPLDELMADDNYGLGGKKLRFDSVSENDIISSFLEEGILSSHQYALPFMRSTEACYVNKTYVEKLGFELPDVLTWDFVFEVSEKAMEKNDDGTFVLNGKNILIPFIYKSTDNMMIHLLKQHDIPYSDESGSIYIFCDDTQKLLYEIASHAKTRAFSTFKISGYPANFLNAGQCIFAVDSTAGATWMGSDAPLIDISEENLVDFETVVFPVPQYDTKNPVMISQGPSMCIFNKEDKGEVMASWLFMQYLLTEDVQIAYSQTEGYVPVTSTAQNSDVYQEYINGYDKKDELHYNVKLDASKLLLENTQSTFVTPVFNGSASLRSAAGQLIEEVTKSSRRKETIDDKYMEKLYSDMKSLYRLDDITQDPTAKKKLGALPKESVIFLTCLGIAWLFIIIYALSTTKKSQK